MRLASKACKKCVYEEENLSRRFKFGYKIAEFDADFEFL